MSDRPSGQRTPRFSTTTVLGVFAACLGALAALLVIANSPAPRHAQPTDPMVLAAFQQHYPGLVARREQVGVPTMMQTMRSAIHYHPHLTVLVDGRPVVVPADIGIDPRQDPMQMAGLHTHDTSGTIHVEGVAHATLGQFFAIWGVPFSRSRLGPYLSSGRRRVRMWVDGHPSNAFGALRLADGRRIVVAYGARATLPRSG